MKLDKFIGHLQKFHAAMILQFSKHENRADWNNVEPDILHEALQDASHDFLHHISKEPKPGHIHEYIVELKKHAANTANWIFILQDKKCGELLKEREKQSG